MRAPATGQGERLIFGRFRRRRAGDRAPAGTIIGAHTTFRGDLAGGESYLVHGSVEGNCDITGHLVLGPTARWRGDITAAHVIVAGDVDGDVRASARLELRPGARIRGDITSPVIALAEGARYDGRIRMQPHPRLVRFTEKRAGGGRESSR